MKTEIWLKKAINILEQVGLTTARLDCLVLLEATTGRDRGWLLAHPEFKLNAPQIKKLDSQIAQRSTHTPLAYIMGKTEFYGREFYINHQVLEPRPESETMIDLLKTLDLPIKPIIIDIGTGSGALAVTAKLELPAAIAIATDIDRNCLDVARHNADTHRVNVEFFEGNLLRPLATKNFQLPIILANLPYVPDSFAINTAALNEPRIAIFGGKDGLTLYHQLFRQLTHLPWQPAFILTESMPPQHNALTKIARSAKFSLIKTSDFIQVFTKNY